MHNLTEIALTVKKCTSPVVLSIEGLSAGITYTKGLYMGLFDSKRGPVFLKDDSSAEHELEVLKSLTPTPEIEQQIKLVEMGIVGEKQIRFELENSHMPMYVLHDLFLEHNGLTAQIDYLIICPKLFYIVECKNLYGNIEIDDKGNFIRNLNFGKYYKKEGIYSPITQNQRHLDLMTAIRKDNVGAIMKRLIVTSGYKTVVVLANPKTVLNDKKAPKEIRNQVIRADQLVAYIKKCEAESKEPDLNDKKMREAAERWLARCKENPTDYTAKFAATTSQPIVQTDVPICQRCGVPMVKRIARRGDNAGQEFWGCPNYPKCRNIVPIE